MRWRSALLMGCSAVALAACGGEQQQAERTTDVGPTIPSSVADPLAARSAKVGALLDSGERCAARKEAAALRADLTTSIENIPEIYLEDLSGLVNEIESQIPDCPQIPPPRMVPPPDEPHGDDKAVETTSRADVLPRGDTPAESARLLSEWLRERAVELMGNSAAAGQTKPGSVVVRGASDATCRPRCRPAGVPPRT